MSKCQQLLKNEGTLWISGTFHIIYSVGYAAQMLDMKFLNNIIWEKPNPPQILVVDFLHIQQKLFCGLVNQKIKT